METEGLIIEHLMKGKNQQEISDAFKAAGIRPNSLSHIEKTLKAVREKHGAKTMFHLGVILARLDIANRNGWIKTTDLKPRENTNVEYSDDAIKSEGTMDYKANRTCMMAGSAGGHGYFSSVGFATDGSQGEDKNLICDDPEYWRYYD